MLRTSRWTLLIIVIGHTREATPLALFKTHEQQQKILIEKAENSYQKAVHTFTQELLLLEAVPAKTNHQRDYLQAYTELYTYVIKRAYTLETSAPSQTVPFPAFKQCPPQPLSTYHDLLNLALKNLIMHHTKLKKLQNFKTTLEQKQTVEELINKLKTIIHQLTHLKNTMNTYLYEFEQRKKARWYYALIGFWVGTCALAACRNVTYNIIRNHTHLVKANKKKPM